MVDLTRQNVDWPTIREGIFAGESGGDQNALYGFQNRPGGRFSDVRVSDMTIDEAIDFTNPSGPYGQWVKSQIGRVATPIGGFQVVGSTLRDAKSGLGLTGGEKFDAATQDKIGQWILSTQGVGAWEGFKNLSPEQAIANQTMRALGKGPGGTPARSNVSGGAGSPSLLGSEGSDMANGQQRSGFLARQRQGGGLLGEGGILSPDRRDRLVMGLEGMTLNPNQALQAAAAQGIQQRATQRQTTKQRNQTGEFLRQRGREDLAAAVESGAIPAAAAVQEALKQTAPTKGVEINGQLVNPVTGELIGDFRTPETDDVPAAVRSLQLRAEAGGLEPGTPAYQEFMIRGGAASGIALQVTPDGGVTFSQGGAAIKPLSEGQAKSTTFSVRAAGALETLDRVDEALISRAERAAEFDPTGLARELQSPEFQAATQAADEFLQAILRKDTGAAITAQEQELYGKTYIPQPGDTPELIQQKREARQRALDALEAGMDANSMLAKERALEKGRTRTGPPPAPTVQIPEIPNFGEMTNDELDAYIESRGG